MTQHRPEQPEVSRDPVLQEAFDAFLHQTHVPRDFQTHVMTRVRQQRARHGLVGWWHRVWAWRLPLVVCGATVGVLLFLTLHVWKPAIKGHSLESAKEVPQINVKGVPQVKETLEVMPRPFAAVLALLEPVKKQAEAHGIDLVTWLNKTGNIPEYDDGEPLVITGETPRQFASHVYVDYYSVDGMVSHLFPNSAETMNPLESNRSFAVGQPDGPRLWRINADPPGLELITVLASKTPLFSVLRNYEPAESYLKELRQALSKEGVQPDVAATFHFIRTKPARP